MVRCGGVAQYGGCRGKLASIGVDLVKKTVRQTLASQPPTTSLTSNTFPSGGGGMQIQPSWENLNPSPPFSGTWGDLKKKDKTERRSAFKQ